jgi:hypothetical protein
MPNVNEARPQTPTSDADESGEQPNDERSSLDRLAALARRLLHVPKEATSRRVQP